MAGDEVDQHVAFLPLIQNFQPVSVSVDHRIGNAAHLVHVQNRTDQPVVADISIATVFGNAEGEQRSCLFRSDAKNAPQLRYIAPNSEMCAWVQNTDVTCLEDFQIFVSGDSPTANWEQSFAFPVAAAGAQADENNSMQVSVQNGTERPLSRLYVSVDMPGMAMCMGNWLNVDSLAPGEEVAVNSFLPWFGGFGLSVSGE